jgi:hypothetical protein
VVWGKSDYKDNEIPQKKSGEARKRASKKEGDLSVIPTRNFCPSAHRAEGAAGVGSGGAFCVSRKAKQKNFHFLKRKNFGEVAIKKC